MLFDKAYVDFAHLNDLNERGVFWVTRAKDNRACRVVRRRIKKPAGKILRDNEILLTTPPSRAEYPLRLRRVVALVEVGGVEREMVFLTNNFAWIAMIRKSVKSLWLGVPRCFGNRWHQRALFIPPR